MAEIICKYFPGVCYTCQKCLYCFEPLQKNLCTCEKNIKPPKISNPKFGQQIYYRAYTPNKLLLSADLFLFAANNKFDYNNDFKRPFTYTLCGACNSKFQRLRSKDKEHQVDNNNDEPDDLDTSLKGLDVENNLSSEEDTVEEDSVEEEDRIEKEDNEEDDIEEVKVQIIVKNKNIKTPTAKFLTIQPVTYRNFVEKIDLVVQKTLEKKNASKDYVILYKVINSREPLNELEDELDF